MADLQKLLIPYRENNGLNPKMLGILDSFLVCYEEVALANGRSQEEINDTMGRIIAEIDKQIRSPYQFEPYHQKIRTPFDYYQLGIDFISPLVKLRDSTLSGGVNLMAINEQVKRGENVVLFANHQIEGDPQVISIMLEDCYPKLAEEMIFVAGERVLVDPLAAPFSMGRNLLCIYSKKYIDTPPEQQQKKQMHNKKTMELMSKLLSEGGKCIYVAPSGGRDRPSDSGRVELSPFDARSIEMFHLMARRSKKKTHFYPLSLATYSILPPPETIQIEMGEQRITHGGAIHLHFGKEVNMDEIPGLEGLDKQAQREAKASYIFNLVVEAYRKFSVDY